MPDRLDWSEPSHIDVRDDDGRMAVAAHLLIGGVAATRGAIQLAMATDEIGASRDGLLLMAVRRLDVMNEQLMNLASGLPPDVVARSDDSLNDSSDVDLRTGTRIEVHSTFNDSWTPGFEVAAVVSGGYEVRRVSDGSAIPGYTSASDLRVARDR